ncbi:hypothetical protein SAMN05660642_01529 [Geodermatophilus siccatus]|uniref:Uncharacterized protein n=1 Tax=Geodermatophilus siccatus TaxID=1137991 RepID=A0A1G9Q8A5_9ACTN|nr:hypothetical protein [Geodermatophilus siccatus]SDM06707.1 hypothetical protein SAMN05660642_01529 [Geodermatophilus siccatus]
MPRGSTEVSLVDGVRTPRGRHGGDPAAVEFAEACAARSIGVLRRLEIVNGDGPGVAMLVEEA